MGGSGRFVVNGENGRIRIETLSLASPLMTFTPSHGSYQLEIGHLLRTLLPEGRVLAECPISTADGVKATDVAWASPERMADLGAKACFTHAPEICVEVVSPGNTEEELNEKMALYFDAGAREVWLCAKGGAMSCFAAGGGQPVRGSKVCPRFPKQVKLG
jgi:Uma2 family endonuclease